MFLNFISFLHYLKRNYLRYSDIDESQIECYLIESVIKRLGDRHLTWRREHKCNSRKSVAPYEIHSFCCTENKYFYIKIEEFTEMTPFAISKLIDVSSTTITNVILDLRNNTGGEIDYLNRFLELIYPYEDLYITKDNSGNFCTIKKNAEKPTVALCFDRVYVLINKNTMSCAELLALAIRCMPNAVLIGEKTHGKGTICKSIFLSNDYHIFVPTHKFFNMFGETCDSIGVNPTVYCDDSVLDQMILNKDFSNLNLTISDN